MRGTMSQKRGDQFVYFGHELCCSYERGSVRIYAVLSNSLEAVLSREAQADKKGDTKTDPSVAN